jgi:hypothetical protein
MKLPAKAIPALLILTAAVGCRSSSSSSSSESIEQMDRPSQTTSVRVERDSLTDHVAAVQNAQTPAAEGDAIRRLRKYESDNGLTYTIRTARTFDNLPVNDPSTLTDPVRAEVTIFRGRDVLRTFQFIAKDNRNLALLGE